MNSTLRIELDGTLITGRVDGIESFVVTIRNQDEEGKIAHSFSSELTFYDDGYQIINTKLIQSISGYGDYVEVRIYDDYCGAEVFSGRIQGDSIDWCEPNCYVSANIIEVDPPSACIQNTKVWDNRNGFLNHIYYGVKYCLQLRPLFVHIVLNLIATLLQIIVFFITGPLFLVVSLVWLICQLIRTICGFAGCNKPDCAGTFNNPTELVEFVEDVFAALNFCGSKHPVAYVRDYINNVCDICGLEFESSILNNANSSYYNLALFSAQVKRGISYNDDPYLIEDNLPVETLSTLMQTYLNPLFNGEYRIVGNKFIFERKDYFFNASNIWIDTDDLLNRGLIEDNAICYSWIDKEKAAYGNYQYSMDASEYIGNEARRRWEDVVEWNPAPANPAQKGGLDTIIPSSCARTITDGIVFDAGNDAQTNANFLYGGWQDPRTMVMSQNRAFNYKFIIINKIGDDYFINNQYSNSFTGSAIPGVNEDERVNYPMWFREGYDNNLYSLFHYINNPRLAGSTNYNFSFTFSFDCAIYQSFGFDKTVSLVMGGQVKYGQVKELSIDFNKRTITVKGIV